MKAALLRAPQPIERNPLELADVPVPQPGPGDVLVRVHACGVCRTDLHVIEGELAPRKSPIIPGHQVVGVVEQTGDARDEISARRPRGHCVAAQHRRHVPVLPIRPRESVRQRRLHGLDGGWRLRRIRAGRRSSSSTRFPRASPICRRRRCCARASSAFARCGYPESRAAAAWASTVSARPDTCASRWRGTGARRFT